MNREKAIKESIAHWKVMIAWVKTRNPENIALQTTMNYNINQGWTGEDCSLCQAYGDPSCKDCPIVQAGFLKCASYDSTWQGVNRSGIWKEWLVNAANMLDLLQSLLITVNKEYTKIQAGDLVKIIGPMLGGEVDSPQENRIGEYAKVIVVCRDRSCLLRTSAKEDFYYRFSSVYKPTSYEEITKDLNLKVGDKVKIMRKAEDYEGFWKNIWHYNMDRNIGKTVTIRSLNGDYGVAFEKRDYSYPVFVLQKVEVKEEENYEGFKKSKKTKKERLALLEKKVSFIYNHLDWKEE